MTSTLAATSTPSFTDASGRVLTSLPQLVRRNAQEYGDQVAYRTATPRGTWAGRTWIQVYEAVTEIAAGIIGLGSSGPEPVGQFVYVMGGNSPDYFIAEYAAQAAGLTAFPLFEAMTSEEMRVTLASYPATLAFSGSADATTRLLAATDTLGIARIVQWGTDPAVDDPRVVTLGDIRRTGADYLRRNPGVVDRSINEGGLDDIACVILTSGTTGTSKGVMGSNAYMLDSAARYRFVYGAEPFAKYLSYLPAAFSVEQYNGLTLGAAGPLDVAFSSAPAKVAEEFISSEASMKYLGPRQWEELRATLPPELLSDDAAIVARRAEIRRDLGLEHVKGCVTAGGSLAAEVLAFFQLLGLPIWNVYGLAEMGIFTATRAGHPSESVGVPLPTAYGADPIEIRIADDGEVQVRGGVRCAGYWGGKSLDVTADGWLRSGDAGVIEDEVLHILDRITNIQRLPNGLTFAPQPIEISAMSSPFFSNFLLIGGHGSDSRIGTLVQVNEEALTRRLALEGRGPVEYADLVSDPAVVALVVAEIEKLNRTLPATQRIALVGILPKPLTVEDGELTRSLKLRRAVVVDRYTRLVDAVYDDEGGARAVTFPAYVGRDGEGVERSLMGFVTSVNTSVD